MDPTRRNAITAEAWQSDRSQGREGGGGLESAGLVGGALPPRRGGTAPGQEADAARDIKYSREGWRRRRRGSGPETQPSFLLSYGRLSAKSLRRAALLKVTELTLSGVVRAGIKSLLLFNASA